MTNTINYQSEVQRLYPQAMLKNINNWLGQSTAYYIDIPTIWMPQQESPQLAWEVAYKRCFPLSAVMVLDFIQSICKGTEMKFDYLEPRYADGKWVIEAQITFRKTYGDINFLERSKSPFSEQEVVEFLRMCLKELLLKAVKGSCKSYIF